MHRIRLHGPWEWRGVADEDPAAASRITVPVDLSNDIPIGTEFQLQRRFNTPTRLAPTDRVWIEIVNLQGELQRVTLNGQDRTITHDVGEQRLTFPVKDALQLGNLLVLTMRHKCQGPLGIMGSCELVIDE
jgi:hypothetical protein